jgi:hypothetical protein
MTNNNKSSLAIIMPIHTAPNQRMQQTTLLYQITNPKIITTSTLSHCKQLIKLIPNMEWLPINIEHHSKGTANKINKLNKSITYK